MRKVIVIVLSAVLALQGTLSSAACAVDETTLREECSMHSQAGMVECLARHVAASEQALRAAEDKLKAALSHWDEEKKYTDLARSKFVEAVAAFNRDRQAQCAFAASLGGGAIGNALETRRLACIAELNYLRARQLERTAAGLAAA